jgi:hydrogenase expression/formation protein HypD
VRYVTEFRDPRAARALIDAILARATQPWRIMEVCGGQTHTLIRAGIDQLLAGAVSLIHGPGCPVCVTPLEKIDRALAVARRPEVTFCTFGDMARVPGSSTDLLAAKAAGADLRIVYSPLDAVRIAQTHPDREVVFFAVGFETTAPANAMAVRQAHRLGLDNFSVLVSHVRVPPAVEVLLEDPQCQVQGFIGPGHVCSVMGQGEYERLARRYGVPFVIAGFEPLDLLQGIDMLVRQLEAGEATVQNQYGRSVRASGNAAAQDVMREVFEVADMSWRGIGLIPRSGLRLRGPYRGFDAETRFSVAALSSRESDLCIAGDVLQGKKRPSQCPAFGTQCTPETPLGAPMVSSEGACAAYHAFGRLPGASHAV